jgi:hypothetical protein
MDGTLIHQLLENIGLDDNYPLQAQLGKRVIPDAPRVTQEHIEMAKGMWGHTEALLAANGALEWEAETTGTAAADVGGTLDMIANCGDKALLIDYKTGMGIQVDPTDNAQILFAAAVCLMNSAAKDMLEGKEQFVAAIIQPDRSGEIRTKTWEFTLDQVNAFWAVHEQQIEVARVGDSKPVAGDHSTFCPANGLCDATTGQMLRMQQLNLKDLENLAWGLDHIEAVKKTISAIEKLAFEQLEVGATIPGWKLVKGRPGNTRWKNPDTAIRRLRRLFGGKAAIMDQALMSPTKILGMAKMAGIKDKVAPIVEELVERPESDKNTLAKTSDPRPAVLSVSALAMSLNSIK